MNLVDVEYIVNHRNYKSHKDRYKYLELFCEAELKHQQIIRDLRLNFEHPVSPVVRERILNLNADNALRILTTVGGMKGGVGPTEDEIRMLIKKSPRSIRFVDNPSIEVVKIALRRSVNNFQLISNITQDHYNAFSNYNESKALLFHELYANTMDPTVAELKEKPDLYTHLKYKTPELTAAAVQQKPELFDMVSGSLYEDTYTWCHRRLGIK